MVEVHESNFAKKHEERTPSSDVSIGSEEVSKQTFERWMRDIETKVGKATVSEDLEGSRPTLDARNITGSVLDGEGLAPPSEILPRGHLFEIVSEDAHVLLDIQDVERRQAQAEAHCMDRGVGRKRGTSERWDDSHLPPKVGTRSALSP